MADRKMPKVSYPQVMRDRAKKDGNRLCMIDTPSLSFGGPCTPEEAEEIAKFASAFVVRRMKRVKEQAATLPAEQPREGGEG